MHTLPREHRWAFDSEIDREAVITTQIICLLLIVLAPLFGVLDVYMYPHETRPMFVVRGFITALTAVYLLIIRLLIRRNRAESWIRPISWLVFYTPIAGLDLIILLAGGAESPYYAGIGLVLLGLFAMMPWGLGAMTAGGGAMFAQYVLVMLAFSPEPIHYRAFASNCSFMLSMVVIGLTWTWVSRDLRVKEFLGRVRLAEKEAALQEEAHVSGALARIAHEMMASIDSPELLERLCALSRALLDCDLSVTWLWEPDKAAYVPVASHGYSAADWESIRFIRLPRERVADLLDRLQRDGIVQISADAPEVLVPLSARGGFRQLLFLALRRGEDLIGCQVMGHRRSDRPYTHEQLRIARGIAQLASMALEHARTLEELARANQVKAHFVAILSHELRNPIAAISGYHSILLDGSSGSLDEQQADLLRAAQKRAQELDALIAATLDLSRFDNQQVRLDIEEVSPDLLLDEIARETKIPAEKPGLQFTCGPAHGLAPIWTDRLKLKMVLSNLITNALKFTERGLVRVDAVRRGEGLEFTVRDTGIGIPAEAHSSIFEPFRQIRRSAETRRDGVGLGLHIVQRLVEILGGRIELRSDVGRGSTFSVWIPGLPSERESHPHTPRHTGSHD